VDKADSRLKVLALLVAMMFGALSLRLWFLQVLAAAQNRTQAKAQSSRIVQTDALRGDIFTADGVTLVDNRRSLEVRVDKQTLEASGQADAVLLRLSALLMIPVKKLRASLDDVRYFDYQPKPVAEFVPKRVAFYLAEHKAEFPGVDVVTASVRDYPLGTTAAHILGYLGQIDRTQLADPAYKNYGQSDLVGKAGLELTYEKYLRGTKGKQKYVVNANGDVIRALGAIPPKPGDNLILSIDSKVQEAVQTELHNGLVEARKQLDAAQGGVQYLKAPAGAAVVLDAKTGGVIAMASIPVQPVVVRERAHEGTGALPRLLQALPGRPDACSPAQPGGAAELQARVHVQAVRRAIGSEGGDRHAERLLPLPGRVLRAHRREPAHPVQQLVPGRPGADVDQGLAPDLVRHRLLRLRVPVLGPMGAEPAGRQQRALPGGSAPVRVRRPHRGRPSRRDRRADPGREVR
jgi:Penicillin-binding Protein dimerisation domain